MYAIVDRVVPAQLTEECTAQTDFGVLNYIPSEEEQTKLLQELSFQLASSVINNLPQLKCHFGSLYPKHLQHRYSHVCGLKTEQV